MNEEHQAPLLNKDLPSDIQQQFSLCCETPINIDAETLVSRINTHLLQSKLALENNEFLDIKTAENIADALIGLVSKLEDYSQEQQSMIVGAARYFILDDDCKPDTKSLLGFDDDAIVINFVLDKLGKPELKV